MGSLDKIALPTVHSLGKGIGPEADEKTALKAFDAYFLGEMLRQSRPKDTTGLFDGGQAGRMYQDHLYQEMARIIAEKGDFGLAGALKGSMGGGDEPANDEKTDESDVRAESIREEGS